MRVVGSLYLDGTTIKLKNSTVNGATNIVAGTTGSGADITITLPLWSTTFSASAATTLTFPAVSGTLATLAGTETFTNKTLTSPKINENVALTTTSTILNLLTSAAGTTGTTSTNIVFSTSPTLVTPTLGVASATTINRVALTAPATLATLTITDGKTLSVSNTLTFTGTDASSVAFGTGGTVAYTNVATLSSLTTVGALNAGSITSGFGAIDIGADALTAGATNITTLVGSDATDSSSSTTGAFKTAGGMGIAKQLVVGTNTIIGGSTKLNTFLERTLSIQSPTSASLEQAGIEIVGDSVSVGDLSSAILFSDNNSAEAHKRYAMIGGYAASAGAITAGGQLAFHTSTTGNTLTEVGRVNEAGAWTLGPANLNGSHTVNGNRIVLKSTNTTTSAILELQPNGSSNGFVGVNGVAANIITSSADRALCLAASGGVAFSGDSGTTLHGSMSTAGAWTLGATGASGASGGHHIIRTGTSGVSTAMYVNGELHFGNSDSGGTIPTIAGTTTTTNNIGLYLSAAANDSNTAADMNFDVRESDTTSGSDFATLTNKAFRWTRYGNELASMTRAGAWTLGATSTTTTHTIQSGGTTILDIAAATANAATIRWKINSSSLFEEGINSAGPGGTNGRYFYHYTAGAYVGGISNAGAWTLGPGGSSATNLVVNGAIAPTQNIIMADGKGIDFAAYTDGSVAGTTTSQVLNDYEEGTWTPAFTSSGGGALSYSFQTGYYTKIGREVTLYFRIIANGLSTMAAGNITVSGLPFTANSHTSNRAAAFCGVDSIGTAAQRVNVSMIEATATMNVTYNTATTSTTGGEIQATFANFITATVQIAGSISYYV